jgi:hypothetical protein
MEQHGAASVNSDLVLLHPGYILSTLSCCLSLPFPAYGVISAIFGLYTLYCARRNSMAHGCTALVNSDIVPLYSGYNLSPLSRCLSLPLSAYRVISAIFGPYIHCTTRNSMEQHGTASVNSDLVPLHPVYILSPLSCCLSLPFPAYGVISAIFGLYILYCARRNSMAHGCTASVNSDIVPPYSGYFLNHLSCCLSLPLSAYRAISAISVIAGHNAASVKDPLPSLELLTSKMQTGTLTKIELHSPKVFSVGTRTACSAQKLVPLAVPSDADGQLRSTQGVFPPIPAPI